MDIALRDTPARWWGTHKKNIRDWQVCRRLMWISVGQVETEMQKKYDRETDPIKHIQLCITSWKEIPQQEWVHEFIHTLETIPKNWYLETKLRHGIMNRADLVDGFVLTFIFENEFLGIDLTLQVVREKIFEGVTTLRWQQRNWVA